MKLKSVKWFPNYELRINSKQKLKQVEFWSVYEITSLSWTTGVNQLICLAFPRFSVNFHTIISFSCCLFLWLSIKETRKKKINFVPWIVFYLNILHLPPTGSLTALHTSVLQKESEAESNWSKIEKYGCKRSLEILPCIWSQVGSSHRNDSRASTTR